MTKGGNCIIVTLDVHLLIGGWKQCHMFPAMNYRILGGAWLSVQDIEDVAPQYTYVLVQQTTDFLCMVAFNRLWQRYIF